MNGYSELLNGLMDGGNVRVRSNSLRSMTVLATFIVVLVKAREAMYSTISGKEQLASTLNAFKHIVQL